MTLHIHNPEADRLAHELASLTGMSIEEAVVESLRERVDNARANGIPAPILAKKHPLEGDALYDAIMEISKRCAALPTYDTRSADEIIGYDENGLPT